jgi:hypothetical protein
VGRVIQLVITFLIIFFLSLYLTKDAPKIRAYIEGLFPRSYQSEWVDLLRRMGYIWQAFFRGQLVLSVSIFLATWGALSLAGMPGALILAIVAGAFEIVPTVGPIIAMIPAVIVALIQGSTVLSEYGVSNFGFALITIGIYFIIQQLENNILVPRVIGRNVNLHPIVVICGVAVGFNVAGVLGALCAAPVIASLRVLGGYVHAKLLDYPPFLNEAPLPALRRQSFTYRRTVTGEELAESSPAQRESIRAPESLTERQQAVEDPAALPSSPEADAEFSTPSTINSPVTRTGVENIGGDISAPGRLDPAV